MRVFLGWAGDEAKAVALALKEWLPLVCPGLQPWISEDITKGARWSAEIATTLRQSKAGVFVLTPDNLTSVWLHYEAGAISNVEGALVCTFLRRIERVAVKPPLDVFQHTTAGDEGDTRHLVGSLEALLPAEERRWDEGRLRKAFDKWWPDLAGQLAAIEPPKGGAAAPEIRPGEIMEQTLALVRELVERDRGRAAREVNQDLVDALLRRYRGGTIKDLIEGNYHIPRASEAPDRAIISAMVKGPPAAGPRVSERSDNLALEDTPPLSALETALEEKRRAAKRAGAHRAIEDMSPEPPPKNKK